MDDDAETTEDDRAVELSTIAAIFPELVFDRTEPFTVSLDLPVSPAKPFAIRFPTLIEESRPGSLLTPPNSENSNTDALIKREAGPSVQDVLYLSHLPPLMLQVTLPEGYPERSPPTFSVSSRLSWLPLSKLDELRATVYTMWEDLGREQMVFSYIDYCQQAAEDGFGLAKSDSVALDLPLDLKISLLDFDRQAKREKFEQETFECGVCLEPKKGSVCHRLQSCSHVFCVECLQDFYNSCITEGDVGSVKCLAPNCDNETNPKNTPGTARQRKRRKNLDRTLDASELLQIPLEQETVQRYVKMKRKKILESDKTTVYCPRQWCQGAARSKKHPKVVDSQAEDSDSEDEEGEPRTYDPNANHDELPPPSERLSICEDCSFAFCKVCKLSWHGEFAKCFPRRKYELTAEEKASEDYLKAHTTPCPTCLARCQKIMGCNHMICYKCDSHFCYLCSSWLVPGNPYVHFNTPGEYCYMKLFELEEGDGLHVVRGPEFLPPPIREIRAPPARIAVMEEANGDGEPVIPPPAPMVPVMEQAEVAGENAIRIRVNAAVQQGLARGEPIQPAQHRRAPVQGLQRFLQMVEDDEEDEWDSDELDEDGENGVNWEIPIR